MDIEQTLAQIPESITPSFSTAHPNAAIQLYDGPVEVEHNNAREQCDAVLYFEWLPSPDLRFKLTKLVSGVGVGQTISLHLPGKPLVLKGHIHSTHHFAGMPAAEFAESMTYPASGTITGEVPTKLADAHEILFHLANFVEYWGENVRDKESTIWVGRAVLRANGWKIAIDDCRPSKQYRDAIQDSGGFGITHAGLLKREDGKAFSRDDAAEALRSVGLYLSFVAGRWISPILRQARAADGSCLWEDWCPYRTSRQRVVGTWFNTRHFNRLPEAFSGFDTRFRDAQWQEAFHLALYWYLESNACAGGVEGSLILIQTALELLSFEILVNERKWLSEDGFAKLPASDSIRLVLASAKIPLDIPAQFKDVLALAKSYGWMDGPAALTGIRNALIHCTSKNRTRLSGKTTAIRDAWELGLWYMDLVLLNLIGYSGKYCDRRARSGFVGDELPVPWA